MILKIELSTKLLIIEISLLASSMSFMKMIEELGGRELILGERRITLVSSLMLLHLKRPLAPALQPLLDPPVVVPADVVGLYFLHQPAGGHLVKSVSDLH